MAKNSGNQSLTKKFRRRGTDNLGPNVTVVQVMQDIPSQRTEMSTGSSSPHRLRLQVVVATENDDGQITDHRKFLHITHGDKNISVLSKEVQDKFKRLYHAERYYLLLLLAT